MVPEKIFGPIEELIKMIIRGLVRCDQEIYTPDRFVIKLRIGIIDMNLVDIRNL